MSVDGMGFLFLAFRADAEEVELEVGERIARLVLDLLVDALGLECRPQHVQRICGWWLVSAS